MRVKVVPRVVYPPLSDDVGGPGDQAFGDCFPSGNDLSTLIDNHRHNNNNNNNTNTTNSDYDLDIARDLLAQRLSGARRSSPNSFRNTARSRNGSRPHSLRVLDDSMISGGGGGGGVRASNYITMEEGGEAAPTPLLSAATRWEYPY